MTINELKGYSVNPALAYALGLIYPFYKEKELDRIEYILGSVNHNSGKVLQSQLNEHYKEIYQLLQRNNLDEKLMLKTNKCDDYSISPKLGFTILIEKTGIDTDTCLAILTDKVKEISISDKSIRTEFVKGCFDGRSSWDTTYHMLSIDVDRNYDRQELVTSIIESLGIELNVNRRDPNHKKNDQLRMRLNSLPTYIRNVGMYSSCRREIIENAIKTLL